MSPYEEVFHLIQAMKEAKSTMEGTDLELFEEKHLAELICVSNELGTVAKKLLSDIQQI